MLNAIIEEIRTGEPIDEEALCGMANGKPFDNRCHAEWAIAKRFVHLYHDLVTDQIRAHEKIAKGEEKIPADPYTVGYPLAHALDALKHHVLKDDPNMGGIYWHDKQMMVDYMTATVDPIVDNSFWYILKMLVMVVMPEKV